MEFPQMYVYRREFGKISRCEPWVSSANRNAALWYKMLKEALTEGFIKKNELYREIEFGHVSLDLAQRVGLSAHSNYNQLKHKFVAPHRRFIQS